MIPATERNFCAKNAILWSLCEVKQIKMLNLEARSAAGEDKFRRMGSVNREYNVQKEGKEKIFVAECLCL